MNKILLNGLIYEMNGAGISKYAYKLMETFISQGYPVDMLIREECGDQLSGLNVYHVDRSISSSSTRIIEEQIRQLYRYKQYNLVHFPDYATPVFHRGVKVATIHDMAMHTMSDKYTLMQNITKKTLLASTIRHAKKLICISEFTKKELISYYPEVQDKAEVIYSGLDIPSTKKSGLDELEVLRNLGINKPFILYVGTIAPHKNITRLIEAFDEVKKREKDYQLVIAGKKGWMYDEVFDEVKARGLEGSVVFTDYVEDTVLEVLYAKAEFFVSISLYEGFGFPPLEAMGRGCPVLVSNIEVFKEMCGEAALYCNPKDTKDIAQHLLCMINKGEMRKKLHEAGLEQVKKFCWKITAEKTYKLYEKLFL